MPTHEIERRIVFTPSEVLAALQLAYPDLPSDPPVPMHLLAKLGSAKHPLPDVFDSGGTPLVSLSRNLESIAIITYDNDPSPTSAGDDN